MRFGGTASARNAGVYRSRLSASGADASNYDVRFDDAALTIGRAALTLAASPASKTYDGTTASTAVPVASGLLAGDTLAGLTQAYVDKNAGSGKAAVVTGYTLADGNGGGNYAVGTVADNAGVVTPAVLTIAAAPLQQMQGTPQAALAGSVSGFVAGETPAGATTGTLAFGTAATPASAPGSYAVQGGGLAAVDGNYVFVQAPANALALTVTPAPVGNSDAQAKPQAPVPNFPDNARTALGSEQGVVPGASLNYVSLTQQAAAGASAAPAASEGTLQAGAAPVAATGSVAAGPDGAPAPSGRARTAAQGSAAVAVRSANGPLDVIVINGGVNIDVGARDTGR